MWKEGIINIKALGEVEVLAKCKEKKSTQTVYD